MKRNEEEEEEGKTQTKNRYERFEFEFCNEKANKSHTTQNKYANVLRSLQIQFRFGLTNARGKNGN